MSGHIDTQEVIVLVGLILRFLMLLEPTSFASYSDVFASYSEGPLAPWDECIDVGTQTLKNGWSLGGLGFIIDCGLDDMRSWCPLLT